jgi:hypothetical protein
VGPTQFGAPRCRREAHDRSHCRSRPRASHQEDRGVRCNPRQKIAVVFPASLFAGSQPRRVGMEASESRYRRPMTVTGKDDFQLKVRSSLRQLQNDLKIRVYYQNPSERFDDFSTLYDKRRHSRESSRPYDSYAHYRVSWLVIWLECDRGGCGNCPWLGYPSLCRALLPRHKKSLYLPDPGALAVITLTANDCTVSA